jgi:O-antigen ligase
MKSAPVVRPDQNEIDESSSLRKIFFYISLIFLFSRLSFLHEVLSYNLRTNTYLVLILGVLTVLGVLLTGGIRRTLRHRPALYLVGFALWAAMAIPFSAWRGGSAELVLSYFRTELPMLFVAAGLAVSWKEAKQILGAIALASIVNLLTARSFMEDTSLQEYRLELFGSIGNSNDFAAHLILMLPFMLFQVVNPKRQLLLRLGALAWTVYGVWMILQTGSRGGSLALGGAICLYMLWAPSRQRLFGLVMIPAALALSMGLANDRALDRILSMFTGKADSATADSQTARQYLFRRSVELTIKNPLFGVGPGEFGDVEGAARVAAGGQGVWQPTHNTLTQVSSECGIGAAIFFGAALLASLRRVYQTNKIALRLGQTEMSSALVCTLVSLGGFVLASLFLSLAYSFTTPLLCGLAIMMSETARRELAKISAVPATAQSAAANSSRFMGGGVTQAPKAAPPPALPSPAGSVRFGGRARLHAALRPRD